MGLGEGEGVVGERDRDFFDRNTRSKKSESKATRTSDIGKEKRVWLLCQFFSVSQQMFAGRQRREKGRTETLEGWIQKSKLPDQKARSLHKKRRERNKGKKLLQNKARKQTSDTNRTALRSISRPILKKHFSRPKHRRSGGTQ